MRMLVLMALPQVQPQAHRHKAPRRQQPSRQRLIEQRQRKHRADEGGQRFTPRLSQIRT
jgi:hypothetical protein